MRTIRARLLLPVLFLILFSACSDSGPQHPGEILARAWKYDRIIDGAGQPVKKVGTADFLTLTDKNGKQSFTYQLAEEGISASGSWVVLDSLLIFSYDLGPVKSVIDSVVFEVHEQTPELELYSAGNQVASVGADGPSAGRQERKFRLLEWSASHLVFAENGVRYFYTYTPPVVEGSITFLAVFRGLIGVLSLLLILYIFSVDKKSIPWKLVTAGILLQIIFAIGVLKVDLIKSGFEIVGGFFVTILSFTEEGSRFVFGDLINPAGGVGFVFAFQILPTIIFFSALTSLLFYLGILQKIVYGIAWIMSKTMKLSGAESLASAANIFIGQTEAPLLVKPYIAGMTRSELLCLMTGGMATIAGGVMAAYIGFLGGDDPEMRLFFAKHLLAASVMSAPAAIVAAKMLIPERQQVIERIEVSKEKIGTNFLEALANGTTDGLKLAVNVAGMLLVFIAMIAMVNYVMRDLIGAYTGWNESIIAFTGGGYDGFTLQFLLGYACAPLSWLMGVCKEDMVLVGQLIGEKTILNEFVAYTTLGTMKSALVFSEEKSIIIATYILCGFANFASIGIQIGGIGSLAPERRGDLSKLGFRALLGGTVASMLTAAIVGMLL
jgi:CNT family concentrative nucleoside transporter